jgi:hypothetical protein
VGTDESAGAVLVVGRRSSVFGLVDSGAVPTLRPDDRRPTTDDRRPTTDDRRPTTSPSYTSPSKTR